MQVVKNHVRPLRKRMQAEGGIQKTACANALQPAVVIHRFVDTHHNYFLVTVQARVLYGTTTCSKWLIFSRMESSN